MKKPKVFPLALLLILTLVSFVSCDLDDDSPEVQIPDTNLIQVANANADLSTLVAAIERAD